jgi:hypothetical protein
MGAPEVPADRAAFAERIRLQMAARYSGVEIDVDPARFALLVNAPGIDAVLPLTPLQNACAHQPERAATLIAAYVASIENHLAPERAPRLATGRLVWCVRNRSYLGGMSRAGELLTREIAADLIAFVAEDMPGSLMRGVPRGDWAAAGLSDDAVQTAAGANTERRFAALAERVRTVDRLPADGWRMAGDPLFQSSIVTVPGVLAAFAERAGGDVLLGVPDRGVALAVAAAQPGAKRFGRRLLAEWREAMNPCSHQMLVTDGASLRAIDVPRRRAGAIVLPWLEG